MKTNLIKSLRGSHIFTLIHEFCYWGMLGLSLLFSTYLNIFLLEGELGWWLVLRTVTQRSAFKRNTWAEHLPFCGLCLPALDKALPFSFSWLTPPHKKLTFTIPSPANILGVFDTHVEGSSQTLLSQQPDVLFANCLLFHSTSATHLRRHTLGLLTP